MGLKKINLAFKIKKPILALGPQTKNTVCFAEGDSVYVSPLHPDLSDPEDFAGFERTVKYFLKKEPEIIAYDLHPEYQSTRYALSLAGRYSLCAVQHHHAHIASCMLENGLKNQKAIGVAFDGTGLGSDNNLWGAEFLICNYGGFKRAAHLREIPLLGGEKAISEPARVAWAWLDLTYKGKFFDSGFDWPGKRDRKKRMVLKNMRLTGFNSPLASSMGRLFDAVASLVLGKDKANFEAELAIELEKTASRYLSSATAYGFNIIRDKSGYIIDPAQMFKEITADLKRREPKEKISCRFHLTVAQMTRKTILILRKETGINKVVLSGGVFQNKLLLCLTLDLLYKEDFKVFTHKDLPCNDSGISLGEAAIANFGG